MSLASSVIVEWLVIDDRGLLLDSQLSIRGKHEEVAGVACAGRAAQWVTSGLFAKFVRELKRKELFLCGMLNWFVTCRNCKIINGFVSGLRGSVTRGLNNDGIEMAGIG